MKLLKYSFALTSLLFVVSCSSFSGGADHSCCDPAVKKTACAEGQCKRDKSCCENKCGNCDGKKTACKSGQCDRKQKKS